MKQIRQSVASLGNRLPGSLAATLRTDSIAARALRPLVNRLMPNEPVPVVVRSGPAAGVRLLINPKLEKYYWTGTHEYPVQEAMSSVLQPGFTVWDVGAHIGFFALLASRAVGPEGTVHAFEPMPANRERLLTSIQLNGAANVRVHDVAVADRSGDATLFAHESSTMWSLLAPGTKLEGLPVQCRTLDEISGSVAAPDVLKIDAEGAEVDILRGGARLLSARRPICIVEIMDEGLLKAARELLAFYDFHRLSDRHWMLR